MRSLFCAWVIACLVVMSVHAEPIAVLNPSFEYVGGVPVGVKTMGVEPDDWNFGNGMPTGGGIEDPSSDGDVCVAVYNTDSIYQLTDHTIVEGDEYNLFFDAYYLWASAGAPYDCTFQGRLYYDNSGSRTVIDYVEDNLSAYDQIWYNYSLSTSIPGGHAAIGNKLGIELTTDQGAGGNSWFGFDNVRLNLATSNTATNPIPSSGSSDVDPGVVLYWTAPAGPTSPDYDVYLGNSPGNLTLVSPAQSATNYDPPADLQNDRIYYWQIDTIDGLDVYPGDLWYFTTQRTSAKVFYIDSVTGDDGNDGLSPGQAWQTLAPVNTMTFIPGDRILFKTGTSYTGQLKPLGSGEDGNPITIDMYGTGNKPAINGGGILDAVLLQNVEYYEVSNLKITNLGASRQNWRTGIKLWANNYGTVHHIYLKDLDVYDVNGSLDKNTEGCGIFIHSTGATPSRFDDVLVENCHVLRTDRNGICMRSNFTNHDSNWFPSLNIVIRENLVEDCGGDAIKPWGADGCLVEYNRVDGARERCSDAAAGIWPWSCDNTLIQYNEVSGVKGTWDGQGFDSDYNCQNSLFQYNYSHDNEGGFMLICGPNIEPGNIGCLNTVVRYNISQNDGINSARVFHISGDSVRNTNIYNNVIYVSPSQNLPLILFGYWDDWPDNTKFYNNIFYVDGMVSYNFGGSTNNVFENNVFYGNHTSPPSDPYAITSDPMLVSAGSGGDGLDSVGGYKLQTGSPCITAGKTIADNGGRDFWCNLLDPAEDPDIGVHAYTHLLAGDCNDDGRVDLEDVAVMYSGWLTGSGCDANADGDSNILDLRILAGEWMFGTGP
jgi:hypothetical protein